MEQQEFKSRQYHRRRQNTLRKALKLIQNDDQLKKMGEAEITKYLQTIWELKIRKINFQQFAARRYRTLKLQLPRVRQTDLVNKICRTWNSLDNRVKVSFRFPYFYGEPTDDQNSDTDQRRIIKKLKQGGEVELDHKKKRVKVNKAMFAGHQSMLQFLDQDYKVSKCEKYRKYPSYDRLGLTISETRIKQFDAPRYFEWKPIDQDFSSSQYEQQQDSAQKRSYAPIRTNLYFKEIQQLERQELNQRRLLKYDAFKHKIYLKNLNERKQIEQKERKAALQEKARKSMIRQFKQDQVYNKNDQMDEQIQQQDHQMDDKEDGLNIQQIITQKNIQMMEKKREIQKLSVVKKKDILENEQLKKILPDYDEIEVQVKKKPSKQALFIQGQQEKNRNRMEIEKMSERIRQFRQRISQRDRFQYQQRSQNQHRDMSSESDYEELQQLDLDKIQEVIEKNQTKEEKRKRQLIQLYKKIQYWSRSHIWMKVEQFHFDMEMQHIQRVTQMVKNNPSLYKEVQDYCNPHRNPLFMLNNDKINIDEAYLRNEQKWFIFKQNGRKYTVCRFCWIQFQIKDQITHWCGLGSYKPLKKNTKKFPGYISVSSDGKHTQRFQISSSTFTTKPPKVVQGPQWTCVRHESNIKTTEQILQLSFIAQRALAFRKRPFCAFISSYPIDFAEKILPKVNIDIQRYEAVYNQPTSSTYDKQMTVQFKFQMRPGLIFGTIGGDIIPRGIIADAFEVDEKYSLYPLSGATFLSFCKKDEDPNCQLLFCCQDQKIYGVLRTLRKIEKYQAIKLK